MIVIYASSVPPRSSTDEVNEQVRILKINKGEGGEVAGIVVLALTNNMKH